MLLVHPKKRGGRRMKTLIEVVMDHLGVEEGEEFELFNKDNEKVGCCPYKFISGSKGVYLLDRYSHISSHELGTLIHGITHNAIKKIGL
jgi:hypothetical protein